MSTFQHLVWDTSPILITLGPVSIRWYSLLFGLAFFLGYLIVQKIYEVEGQSDDDIDNLMMFAFFSTLFGARLGHCLFYAPEHYLANPIEILYFWNGGLASHGAAIGNFLGIYLYTLRKKVKVTYPWLIDRLLLPCALGAALIRLGNFFNSEIIGNPAPNIPWAVIFSHIDKLNPIPRHPTQIYESICYFIIFLIMISTYAKYKSNIKPGLLTGLFLSLVFSSRFLLEFTKSPQSALDANAILSTGQLLSIPLFFLGLYFIFRKNKPT